MRALCVVCGADMWPCRPNKMFCSAACIETDRRQTETTARIEELAKRKCLRCGAPIPLTATRRRRYCSTACEPPPYYAGSRECAWCGQEFRAVGKDQRCCSISCGAKSRRRAESRPCKVCGIEIETPLPEQIYCSPRCNQRAYRERKRRARAGLSGEFPR
ncbi:hypothetical protein XM52_03950 [Roseovarius indicus]|uniref:MYND finger n=1 Tax=Roseovarius indicus TaxID=540747 RepID=A0A0T5PCE3_9RHOB|nr:hypothetical protein XM52_03950 [Roseovarius indicus]